MGLLLDLATSARSAPTVAPVAPVAVSLDPAAEARRQRLLAMLKARPGARYAVLTDTEADPAAVIMALAIRGRATCELRIPRDKWDGVLFLELLDRHIGTVQ